MNRIRGTCLEARGQSKTIARRLYPTIKFTDSPQARKWNEIYGSLPANDPLQNDPDTSLKITIRAANALGIFASEWPSKGGRATFLRVQSGVTWSGRLRGVSR